MKLGKKTNHEAIYNGLYVAKQSILKTITQHLHTKYLEARQSLGVRQSIVNTIWIQII